MNLDSAIKSAGIRQLNDLFRRSFIGGAVVVTQGVKAMGMAAQTEIVRLIRGFEQFDQANDPYAEHDFGAFEHEDVTIFFKIDYYNRSMEAGSPDPSDPSQTTRVLTIMTADEY